MGNKVGKIQGVRAWQENISIAEQKRKLFGEQQLLCLRPPGYLYIQIQPLQLNLWLIFGMIILFRNIDYSN